MVPTPEDRSALSQDIGNPEGAADLDQLAPGDQDLFPLGGGIERQHQRGCGVVHREAVLAPLRVASREAQ